MPKSILKMKSVPVFDEPELSNEEDVASDLSEGEGSDGFESYDESVSNDTDDLLKVLNTDGNEADISDAENGIQTSKKKKKLSARVNRKLLDGQDNQQYSFAAVMSNLLYKKSVESCGILSQSSEVKETCSLKKSTKRRADTLEVVDDKGNIEEILKLDPKKLKIKDVTKPHLNKSPFQVIILLLCNLLTY